MRGTTGPGNPYKLASHFRQPVDSPKGWVLEVFGVGGVGIIHTTEQGTIEQVMDAAQKWIDNNPTTKGYTL